MERYERLWERLLTVLGALGEVEESPGRLVLTIDGDRLDVVMSEQEWDDMVSVAHGSFGSAVVSVLLEVFSADRQDLPFLVYDTYQLHPSATPERGESQ